MSTTELVNTADGITGYADEVAGQETKKSGLFRGTRLKFGQTAEWEVDGEVIDPETRLILIDIARIVTKWADKKPVETVVLEPGEKWPDVELWNDKVPRTEWIQGMNGLRGPWQSQRIVYLLDPTSMSQYHWPDGTVGGGIAIREAVDSIKAMRRFRPGAAPVVELSSKFMNTKFGGRQRPHFEIHNWVSLPGAEPQPAALPAPPLNSTAAPVIEARAEPAAKPAAAAKKKPTKRISTLDIAAPLTPVKPVTLREELNDEIPL
jgi:hypothetical protein